MVDTDSMKLILSDKDKSNPQFIEERNDDSNENAEVNEIKDNSNINVSPRQRLKRKLIKTNIIL